ncbi:MAG: TolC family protein [Gemmataceae bacterium]|nr:TolC family protein [Gemmataceae bacterium]
MSAIWLLMTASLAADPAFPPATPAESTAYGISLTPTQAATTPIDLATALRLAGAQNPAIALAQARYREALAVEQQNDLLWLPNVAVGTNYFRRDGVTQNQAGLVFQNSRSNLFAGSGVALRVDTADAYYLPLVSRQVTRARAYDNRAAQLAVSFESASAYLDLLHAHVARGIVAGTIERAEQMRDRAESAIAAGISKTAGDANRARAEVALRRQEDLDFRAKCGAASARLARVLAVEQNSELVPADLAAVPLTLVPRDKSMDELILTAWTARPELAAQQSLIAAAHERLRQAKYGPLFPKIQTVYTGGTFGGGRNDFLGDFGGQGDVVASAFWELKNLGFGNRAQARERQAQLDQVGQAERAVRLQVATEVAESARIAAARIAAVLPAQKAVTEATELYRKLLDSSFGMAAPVPKYDPLEPLLAIQALHQAQLQLLAQIIEHNRAQFRLYTALGQPAECAVPVEVPAVK